MSEDKALRSSGFRCRAYLALAASEGDVNEAAGVCEPLLGATLGHLLLLLLLDLRAVKGFASAWFSSVVVLRVRFDSVAVLRLQLHPPPPPSSTVVSKSKGCRNW